MYNAAPYLAQALASVKAQTIGFENIEWLLVDDCSTDGSYALLEKWAAEYPNLRVLRTEKNSGSPAAPRNLGLDNATAPYLMFLDNDDMLFPDACRVLYDKAEETGVDLVSGDVRAMDWGPVPKKKRETLIVKTPEVPAGSYRMSALQLGWLRTFTFNHWCKIYRRAIVEKYALRCLEGEMWEDILFLALYLMRCETLEYIKEPIISYRIRPESLSHVQNKYMYCSIPKSIELGIQRAEEFGTQELYARILKQLSVAEFYVDQLLDDDLLPADDITDALCSWARVLVFCMHDVESAYCVILSDDFSRGDRQQAIFHFFELKKLYKQRQKELKNIFCSTTWRVASALQKLKFWGKTEARGAVQE